MSTTGDCPQGRSQDLTFAESDDKILVDHEICEQVFSLLLSIVDDLSYVRHREIFLKCLRKLFLDSVGLDDAGCTQAVLLLEAYSEPAFPALAQFDSNLEEALNLMREVRNG